ncbi:MAG: ion transporter [Spirochaetota bacterium]
MRSKVVAFLENVVILAIVLVLVQTFLQDLASLYSWTWPSRRVLLFIGFGFDIFFTIEFLVRLYFAVLQKRGARYFLHERGWVDFVASIPLLLLDSGPAVLALAAGGVSVVGFGAMVRVLKVVKAIRIARILRLLRVLKIFRRIKNTDSTMAQRHVAKIATMGTTIVVAVLLLFTVASAAVDMPSLAERFEDRTDETVAFIRSEGLARGDRQELLESFAEAQPSIIRIERDGETLYSRYDSEYIDTYLGPVDYGYLESGSLGVFVDIRDLNADQARQNLVYFIMIVALVALFMLYYSPHFAMTVSDPIHIMRRGMGEAGYNLEIRIPERFREDEVYRLAQLYNEVYLPLKDRAGTGDEAGISELKMDDLEDFFDKGR